MPSRPQLLKAKRNASMAGGIENPWKYQVSKGFCFNEIRKIIFFDIFVF